MQATQLIAEAYYLSGIVSREFSTVTNTETTDGLGWLNEILSEKSINGTLIPYITSYELNTITGEPIYDVQGLISLDTMTFNLGTVRFEMRRDSLNRFFGSNRVDDVSSLPFTYYAERNENGMRLYLYFVPDQDLVLKIKGKFAFLPIPDVNTPLTYDLFYIKYLKYELASSICDYFNTAVPDGTRRTLVDLRRSLLDLTGVDLTITTKSLFPARPNYDNSDATISRGWRP